MSPPDGIDLVAGVLGGGLGACGGPMVARVARRHIEPRADGPTDGRTDVRREGPETEAPSGAAVAAQAGIRLVPTTVACVAALGAVGVRVGFQQALPAYLYLAAVGVALWIVDLRTRRLPDALTLPSYGVTTLCLAVAAVTGSGWEAMIRALLAAVVVFGAYMAICALSYGSVVGFGDVKLAGVLALSLGWAGWDRVVVAVLVTHLLAALLLVALVVTGGRWRGRTVAFGPYLLTGWVIAVVWFPPTA